MSELLGYWGIYSVSQLNSVYGWGIWNRDPQVPFTEETDEAWEAWVHRNGSPWEGHVVQGTGPCLACHGRHVAAPSVVEESAQAWLRLMLTRQRVAAEESKRKIETMVEEAKERERVRFAPPLHF